LTIAQNNTNQANNSRVKLLSKCAFITKFESSGSLSESDDDSDSGRSGSATSLCSFYLRV